MEVNPIVEEKHVQMETYKQFLVEFITRDTTNIHENENFQLVKKFCKDNSIRFMCRGFDSFTKEEDREYIVRLPAIHIYKQDQYINTLFMTHNPVEVIEYEIEKNKHKPVGKNYLKLFLNIFKLRKMLRS